MMRKFCGVYLLAFALLHFSVHAQLPGGNPAGLSAAMTKLFGAVTAFSSKAEVRMLDKAQKETMSMSMDFALLDGKIRQDINLGQIKHAEMAAMLASLREMKITNLSAIVRPDKQVTYVIYPELQSYMEAPTPPEQPKIEKTALGKETIDGHPCEKSKVTITGEKGEKKEVIVWNATDMKQFPIQMQMNEGDGIVFFKFKNVQLKAPEAGRFEPPANFTKYANMETLMQGAMLKMLGGGK